MVSRINLSMTRGLLWERLIVIKNRRTHRVINPGEARCMVKVGTTKISIPVTITKEGGMLLSLDPNGTLDFTDGEHDIDIIAPIRNYWTPVAKGKLTVTSLETVTPIMEAQTMEIRKRKNEDKRESFTWTDASGEVLTVVNAYMQAKDEETDTVVIDLRFFSSAPNEAAILALPGEQRGYLAPLEGESLELHISDMNTAPAGIYPFDLFVQGEDGDWTMLAAGTVVIESSISVKPA